jgi:hypothetical protein
MRAALAVLLACATAVPVVAQPPDPALQVARWLARRVPAIPNFRATYRGPAVWWTRPEAVWSIRPERRCHEELTEAGVPWRPMRWTPTPVPAPVEIVGPVGGVVFEKKRDGTALFLSCETALRLPHLARVLRDAGVQRAEVMSAYRREPATSFHSVGLALDLSAFDTARGRISVEEHFALAPETATCDARPPTDRRARALLDIACALARSDRWSTVLTPNYGRGHHDHFHIDARPDDARVFVR